MDLGVISAKASLLFAFLLMAMVMKLTSVSTASESQGGCTETLTDILPYISSPCSANFFTRISSQHYKDFFSLLLIFSLFVLSGAAMEAICKNLYKNPQFYFQYKKPKLFYNLIFSPVIFYSLLAFTKPLSTPTTKNSAKISLNPPPPRTARTRKKMSEYYSHMIPFLVKGRTIEVQGSVIEDVPNKFSNWMKAEVVGFNYGISSSGCNLDYVVEVRILSSQVSSNLLTPTIPIKLNFCRPEQELVKTKLVKGQTVEFLRNNLWVEGKVENVGKIRNIHGKLVQKTYDIRPVNSMHLSLFKGDVRNLIREKKTFVTGKWEIC